MSEQPIRAVTSASNIYRRALCPGSARMEAGLAEPEQESEWSAEGTLLHKCFMVPDAPERATLTLDQRETVERAERLAEEFFAAVRAQFGIPEDHPFVDEKERELWFIGESGERLFPGHCDLRRTWVTKDLAISAIVDAKFGYVPVEHALDNLQLASYGASSWQEDCDTAPDDSVAVAIIQPRAFGPRLTQAVYTAEQMPDTIKEIRDVYENSLLPDAPLIAGEKQCFHCKAKATCPAYAEVIRGPLEARQSEWITPIYEVTNEQLEELKTAIQFASKIEKQVNTELRRRIELGSMPGWKLRNGGDEREVVDPVAMFRAFMQYFERNQAFTAAAYDECRKMNWGKLEALARECLGVTEKRAKEIVSDISEPFVTRTPKEKSPVRDTKFLK